MLRQLLQPIVRTSRTGARSYHIPNEVKPPTMDEVIVPCGPWKEAKAKIERRYNLQLAAGIIIFVTTIAIGRINGTLWLNYLPPKEPKEAEE